MKSLAGGLSAGEFLKELDLAEGRNTGIGKIVRAMRENGSPDPQFYNPETRSFMTVILPIHEAFKEATTEKKSEPVEKTVVESAEKSVEKRPRTLPRPISCIPMKDVTCLVMRLRFV